MKNILFGAVIAYSAVAHAQSSVSLYGAIDEGIDYTSNVRGHSNTELQSGYLAGDRFGLRGTEDLGGGVAAIFKLESGFDLNNGHLGEGGRLFSRQAYVGLSLSGWGTVTAGRQYDSFVEYVAPITANGEWAGYLFSHPSDNDNTDNSWVVDNSIKYKSPDWNGFQFGALYGFSNEPGAFADDRLLSVAAKYATGPLEIAAGYMDVDNPASATSKVNSSLGAVTASDGSFVAAQQRIFGAAIKYALGKATLAFAYTDTYLLRPTADLYVSGRIGGPSSLRFNNYEFNVRYEISPALHVGAMYTFTEGSYKSGTTLKPRWNEAGLMADYILSKSTKVYVQGAYQIVSGDRTGTPGIDNAYIPGADDSSSGRNQAVMRVGIMHRF